MIDYDCSFRVMVSDTGLGMAIFAIVIPAFIKLKFGRFQYQEPLAIMTNVETKKSLME